MIETTAVDRIVLIEDLADDLLEQVFHRHQAGRAAVLVEHDREMRLEALHVGEHIFHFTAVPGNEQRLADDFADDSARLAGAHWPRRTSLRGGNDPDDFVEPIRDTPG